MTSIRLALRPFLIIAVLLLVVSAGPAAAEADQEAIALDWIAAHNSASVETMKVHRDKHFRRSTASDWEASFQAMFTRMGHLEVHGIMIDAANEIQIQAASEHDGRLNLVFSFHPDEPDQIKQVGIGTAGGNPSGDLPPLQFLSDSWPARGDLLDRYLSDLAGQDVFSGTVMVIEKGKKRFEGAYGLASREFGVPNTLVTRFDVGSFNKDYTRVAILQLLQKGKLALSDKVGRHLPDYPNREVRKQVTIQQLLDHTSGLGDYFTEEYFATPMRKLREIDDYIPIWGPKPLEFKPGERSQYSNYGYTVLGAIIEKLSGMSYPNFVVKNIFEPAGMVDSGFFETDIPEPNVAVGYTDMGPDGSKTAQLYKNIYLEPAKGGPWGKAYSTIEDLYLFFEAMFEGRLLSAENNWLSRGWEIRGIALAGGGPGLNAFLSLDNGTMILVMANLDPPAADNVAQVIRAALDGGS